MNDAIQPEELTELLDDDLEMWAVGGTRILPNPKSQSPAQTTPSYPPVAYTPASVPPPPLMQSAPVTTRSSAPIWAAVIGMTAVFGAAAIAGAVFLFMHRDNADAPAELSNANASTVSVTTAITTAEPAPVTVTDGTESEKVAPTKTTLTAAPVATVAQPKLGMVQTWSIGNGKPIYVDGVQVGVGGGRVKAACGKHSVRVGDGKAKTYDIPCNGSAIVVGTPDGQ